MIPVVCLILVLSGFAIEITLNSNQTDEDDDDDDYDEHGKSTRIQSKEEKRRISHTTAEQKRRNAIKVPGSLSFFFFLCLYN